MVGFFFLERLEFLILELGASFLGLDGKLWGLFFAVGPGGRISTGFSQPLGVLNVNRSLYGSTSRVERSE